MREPYDAIIIISSNELKIWMLLYKTINLSLQIAFLNLKAIFFYNFSFLSCNFKCWYFFSLCLSSHLNTKLDIIDKCLLPWQTFKFTHLRSMSWKTRSLRLRVLNTWAEQVHWMRQIQRSHSHFVAKSVIKCNHFFYKNAIFTKV